MGLCYGVEIFVWLERDSVMCNVIFLHCYWIEREKIQENECCV